MIDFELFRPILEDAVLNKNKKNNSGAKPYVTVLLFKILILQRIYNLSDEAAEYQIIDILSFKNFLGLASGDKVPDQNTIWPFREKLGEKDTVSDFFNTFHALLQENGLMINEGKMIDTIFVEAPRQRNTREKNAKIKAGQGDELWNDHLHKNARRTSMPDGQRRMVKPILATRIMLRQLRKKTYNKLCCYRCIGA